MNTSATTAPASGLGGIFAIAFGIFGAAMLALVAPPGFPSIPAKVIFLIIGIPLVLFLGNAVNQRLNLLLFGRELPIGIFTLVAFPTVLLLAAVR
jgi:hypothetical protein